MTAVVVAVLGLAVVTTVTAVLLAVRTIGAFRAALAGTRRPRRRLGNAVVAIADEAAVTGLELTALQDTVNGGDTFRPPGVRGM